MLCLFGLVSYTSYAIIDTLFVYFSYQVFTVAKTVYETPTLFPKITICNKNLFTTKYAFDLIKQRNETNLDRLQAEIFANWSDKLAQKERLQHSFDEILLECSFNTVKCTYRDFASVYDANLGWCYEFNSGRNQSGHSVEIKEIMRAGSLYGLKLTLYAGFYELMAEYNKYVGVIVQVSNSSYFEVKDGIEVIFAIIEDTFSQRSNF